MIGIDTNVLIRYVVRDDDAQAQRADTLFDSLTAEAPGYIGMVVLVESWWLLARTYKYPTARCRAFVEGLLESQEIRLESPDLVRSALRRVDAGADLADALIAERGLSDGCRAVMTFDPLAAAHAGMTLLA